jgi:DNA-binding transcriptional LysR family regulator
MELRHLGYFVATVEWKSLREASRRIRVAQPAISQTISNLETELGVKLLTRSGGRSVKLTSERQLFYQESLKTLKQADHSIEFVQRAARGEVGTLSIGFCGGSMYAFLPDLVRKFKEGHPGVKVNLLELKPADQEAAFLEGAIDVGFTRPLSPEISLTHHSRLLYRERLFAVLPSSRGIKAKSIKIVAVRACSAHPKQRLCKLRRAWDS